MQITPLLIYLINISDNLLVFSQVAFTLVTAGLFMFVLIMFVEFDPINGDSKLFNKGLKILIPLVMVLGLLALLLPDKKTIYEMIIVPKAANSKLVQNIPNYIDSYLNKLIEIKP